MPDPGPLPAPPSKLAQGALVFGFLMIGWEILLAVAAGGVSGPLLLGTLFFGPALSLAAIGCAFLELRRGGPTRVPLAAVLVNMFAMGLILVWLLWMGAK